MSELPKKNRQRKREFLLEWADVETILCKTCNQNWQAGDSFDKNLRATYGFFACDPCKNGILQYFVKNSSAVPNLTETRKSILSYHDLEGAFEKAPKCVECLVGYCKKCTTFYLDFFKIKISEDFDFAKKSSSKITTPAIDLPEVDINNNLIDSVELPVLDSSDADPHLVLSLPSLPKKRLKPEDYTASDRVKRSERKKFLQSNNSILTNDVNLTIKILENVPTEDHAKSPLFGTIIRIPTCKNCPDRRSSSFRGYLRDREPYPANQKTHCNDCSLDLVTILREQATLQTELTDISKVVVEQIREDQLEEKRQRKIDREEEEKLDHEIELGLKLLKNLKLQCMSEDYEVRNQTKEVLARSLTYDELSYFPGLANKNTVADLKKGRIKVSELEILAFQFYVKNSSVTPEKDPNKSFIALKEDVEFQFELCQKSLKFLEEQTTIAVKEKSAKELYKMKFTRFYRGDTYEELYEKYKTHCKEEDQSHLGFKRFRRCCPFFVLQADLRAQVTGQCSPCYTTTQIKDLLRGLFS